MNWQLALERCEDSGKFSDVTVEFAQLFQKLAATMPGELAAQLCDVVTAAVADEREQAFRLGWQMRK
jgi:hypothetical protein